MKKYLFLLACVGILCFCGCGDKKSAGKVDPINCESAYMNYAVSGDDGYYFLCGGLVAFWDGNPEHQAVPICNSPGCKHKTDDCPGRISTGNPGKLFYVDGWLYAFSQWWKEDPVTKEASYPLWRISADGSSKEKVFYVEGELRKYTIYEDMVYYQIEEADEKERRICSIWSVPLKGGDATMIWKSGLQYGNVSSVQGFGGKIYFDEEGVDMSLDMNDPDLDFKELHWEQHGYVYDPKTKELQTDPLGGEEELLPYASIRSSFEGNLMYVLCNQEDNKKNEWWYKPKEEGAEPVYLGKQRPKAATESSWVSVADLEYRYMEWRDSETETSGLKVYDYKDNLIYEVQDESYEDWTVWVPGSEKYVFGYRERQVEEAPGIETTILLLERDKFADGTAKVIPLISN